MKLNPYEVLGLTVAFFFCVAAIIAAKSVPNNFRECRWWRVAGAVVLIGVAACGLWANASDDPRDFSSVATDVILGGVALLVVSILARRGVRIALWAKVLGTVLIVLTVAFSFVLFVFRMHPMSYGTSLSPDGRYEARLIYFDSMTSGFYFVSLQKVSPLMRMLPVDEVVESGEEGFDAIHWVGDRTLVLDYDKDADFVMKDTQWHDVAIEYHLDAQK